MTWTRPEGGFYSWITLPESVDSYELCMTCIDRGVVFVPGTAFYTDGRGTHEARVSFCHPPRRTSARVQRSSPPTEGSHQRLISLA